MAAVFQQRNIGVRKIGQDVSVPESPTARMMYYLNCMCNVLDLSQNNSDIGRLTNYGNYYALSEDEIDTLTTLCLLLGPDELEGKCIFNDDEMCGNSQNEFYELEAVTNQFLITNSILIGGKETTVRRIMTYKSEWMRDSYLVPLVVLAARLSVRMDENKRQTNQPRAISYDTYSLSSDYHSKKCCCNIL